MGCGKSQENAAGVISANNITLHYFDFHARADTMRMILYYHGISFSDHRVQFDKWPALKQSGLSEFGALPVLEIDGYKLIETRAIEKYIAKKYGYYPNNIADSYWVDSLCDLIEEAFGGVTKAWRSGNEENVNKYYNDDGPYYLRLIETRLKRNNGGNGWFVGNSVSLNDFSVFSYVFNYYLRPDLKPKYEGVVRTNAPKVLAFTDRFLATSPKLKSYLDTRQPKII